MNDEYEPRDKEEIRLKELKKKKDDIKAESRVRASLQWNGCRVRGGGGLQGGSVVSWPEHGQQG